MKLRTLTLPIRRFYAGVAATFRNLFISGADARSGIGHRVAGMTVNESTALTLPAYLAVIRVLASTVAMLPRSVFVRETRGRRKTANHPTSRLVNNPNPWMIPQAFWEVMIGWAASTGSGRARIVRDPLTGEPTELWPIEPWRIRKEVRDGELWYFWDAEHETIVLSPDEVFDLYGFGGDGLCGYSLIAAGSRAIGTGLARQEYAASYFENGIWGCGVVKYPAPLSDKGYERLKKSIDEDWTGPQKGLKPLVFDEGAEWQTLRLPNKDAQLIEVGEFTVLEICRLAGVPPQKVFALDRMIYANIEHMQIEWIQSGVMPWTTRIEQEAKRKLIPGPFTSPLYLWHNVDGLQRGDFKSRAEAIAAKVNSAGMTPNEGRALDEMPPMGPEGDVLYMQGAMLPLKDIFDPPEPPTPAPSPFGAPPASEPDPDEEGADTGATTTISSAFVPAEVDMLPPDWRALAETLRPAFDAAARHFVRRETKTVAKVRERYANDQRTLIGWANTWYSDQRNHLVGAFGPPIDCACRLACAHEVAIRATWPPILNRWQREGIERATSGAEYDEDALTQQLSDAVFEQVLAGEEPKTCAT